MRQWYAQNFRTVQAVLSVMVNDAFSCPSRKILDHRPNPLRLAHLRDDLTQPNNMQAHFPLVAMTLSIWPAVLWLECWTLKFAFLLFFVPESFLKECAVFTAFAVIPAAFLPDLCVHVQDKPLRLSLPWLFLSPRIVQCADLALHAAKVMDLSSTLGQPWR